MIKTDVYREGSKIISCYMDRTGNTWRTKHIKKNEILETDYLVSELKRFNILSLEFSNELVIITDG